MVIRNLCYFNLLKSLIFFCVIWGVVSRRFSVLVRSSILIECLLKMKDIFLKVKVYIEVIIFLRKRKEGKRKKGIIDVIN